MRPNWMNRIKLFTAAVAAGAAAGPVAFADNPDAANVEPIAAMEEPTVLPPGEGYELPPLPDHMLIAQLDDDEECLEQDQAMITSDEEDGTATGYNRDYYAEPVQVVELIVIPMTLEAVEALNVSDDGTAQQYDRGYYKDPEVIVALIIVPSDEDETVNVD